MSMKARPDSTASADVSPSPPPPTGLDNGDDGGLIPAEERVSALMGHDSRER